MPEGTIFQDQNPMIQSSQTSASASTNPFVKPLIFANREEKKSPKFNPRRLIKFGSLPIIILAVLLVILNIILPRFNNSEQKVVTLTYWGIKEDSGILAPLISDFEKENPNIRIIYSKQDRIDYREKLTTRIENGTGPDIFEFHNTWYPMLGAQLLPLPQETIEKKQFTGSFYDVSQKDLIKNGAIYAVPLGMDTLVLYINTKIFEDASTEQKTTIAVPTIWQEFVETSTKLTKRDESGRIIIAGAGIGTFENVSHAPDIISLLFAQNGVDISSIANYEAKIADALQFYTNFSLIENSVWDSTLDPSLIAFSQGKLAMFFGYYQDYSEIKKANPNLTFKVAPVPQLLLSSKFNIASYWADGVSAKSKNQKEALLFMKFLAKKETARKLHQEQSKARALGEPYANKNLADELKNTEEYIFLDQAKTAVSTPFADNTFDNGLNDGLNSVLKEAVTSILNGGDSESAAKTLLESYSQIVGQYAPKPVE